MRVTQTGIVATAILIAAVAALAGCSQTGANGSTGSASEAEPQIGAIGKISRPSDITRPIDEFRPSVDEVLQILRARHEATVACLAREQPSFTADQWPQASDMETSEFVRGLAADETLRSDLWGFFDPDSAGAAGYERAPGSVGSIYTANPTGVSDSVFHKCSDKVRAIVPGKNDPTFLVLANALPSGGPKVPANDSRYVAVVKKWSNCMRAAGFDYPDPVAAVSSQMMQSAGQVSPSEIAIASNDIRCKLETNLVGIALAVQSAYDQRYIDAHHAELTDLHYRIAEFIRSSAE